MLCWPLSRRCAPTQSSSSVREELRSFVGIRAADPTAEFSGRLRAYQREGLGWLYFLQRFGFGGCLADDMGLGKTIQVLALLESRRDLRAAKWDKNLAVHRSWLCRARWSFTGRKRPRQFAPKLRVLDHTGGGRLKPGDHFDAYDVVLTTYGTLRRDALQLKDLRFDYCILDEAQAIKNAGTLSAKAARLLQRRLSAGYERHAGGKPSGRAVEPFRVSQPRDARERVGVWPCGRGTPTPTHGTCWREPCGLSSYGGRRERLRASCRQKPSRRFIAISSRGIENSMMSCATITARDC